YASNLLLSVWLNQGLRGLVACLGILAMYYRFVGLVLERRQSSMLLDGLWSGVTAALGHGRFCARDCAVRGGVASIFFVAIGLTVAHGQSLLRQDATELSTGHGIQHRLRYGLVAFVLIAVLLVIFRAHILAAWYTNLGALDETRADFAHNLTSSE